MKKLLCISLTVILLLTMGGCKEMDNKTPGEKPQTLTYEDIYSGTLFKPDAEAPAGQSLHYSCDGYFGDVHPFYHDGKMYMFYLSTGRETGSVHQPFSSMLCVSDDMIHYQPVELVMDPANPPEQELYFALGVYVDADGRFRSCYGKGSYVGGSVSDELITWSNGAEPYMDEETTMLRYKYRVSFDSDVYSGRDPYITYDSETESYYCVVMNYYSDQADKGEKGLALYIGNREGIYSTKAVKLVSFTGTGDPECPQLLKIGNRWYLFYSVYGSGAGGGVGGLSYRMGGEGELPQNVDWENAREYSLDGGDLHAAQLVNVGDKLYMYGWLNYEPHANVWGGYLNLPREVYQSENGTLLTRCDPYLTEKLNKGQWAQFTSENTVCKNISADAARFVSKGNGMVTLQQQFGRTFLTADLTLPAGADCAGFTLTQGSFQYFVGLRREEEKLILTVSSQGKEPESAYIRVDDASTIQFRLKVIVDGPFVEAFVNDSHSVSAHTRLKSDPVTYGLLLNGAETAAEDATVNALADYQNIGE